MVTHEKLYQIGEVAKKTGISIDTIRYYEKEGLSKSPVRSEGGFRKYPFEAIEKLRFVKKAQSLGFSLGEIRQIMQESEKGLEDCCNYVSKVLKSKLGELEVKINELQKMRKELRSLIKSWVPLSEARKRPYNVCPQLERSSKRGGKK